MDPYRSHDNIGLGDGRVGKRLGNCPNMVGQVGGTVYEVRGEEEGNRIAEDCGHGGRDEKGCDDMTSSVAAVSRKSLSKGVGWGEDRAFGGSVVITRQISVGFESEVMLRLRLLFLTLFLGKLTLAAGTRGTKS